MSQQKYLLNSGDLPVYTEMYPFVHAARDLTEPSSSSREFGFQRSGMGRTRIGERLAAGFSPRVFYNEDFSSEGRELKQKLLIREFWNQMPEFERSRPDASYLSDREQEIALIRWKEGTTGYFLIDAGMRQLAEEGWMPSRVRMLCASFLTKNLGVWWEYGAKHFADLLIDYNERSNKGNWLWFSGEGFSNRITDLPSPDSWLRLYDYRLEYVNSILKTPYSNADEAIASQTPWKDYAETRNWFVDIFRQSRFAVDPSKGRSAMG